MVQKWPWQHVRIIGTGTSCFKFTGLRNGVEKPAERISRFARPVMLLKIQNVQTSGATDIKDTHEMRGKCHSVKNLQELVDRVVSLLALFVHP